MYYLIHQTNLENLSKALFSKALLPLSKTKTSSVYSYGIEDEDEKVVREYKNKIFTSLIFPTKELFILNNKINEKYDENEYTWKNMSYKGIYLIFDYEKVMNYMRNKEINFYCRGWNYGEFIEEKCIKYNNKISPIQNAKNWINKDKEIFKNNLEEDMFFENGTLGNEVVFSDILPLDFLLYIYVHISQNHDYSNNKNLDDEYTDKYYDEYSLWSMKEVRKIEELKNKYFRYEWRIDIGESNKEIPFYKI